MPDKLEWQPDEAHVGKGRHKAIGGYTARCAGVASGTGRWRPVLGTAKVALGQAQLQNVPFIPNVQAAEKSLRWLKRA